MKTEALQINGFTIRFLRFGKADGKPFVIIPGVSIKSVMNSAIFIEEQYKLLADEYDVYVIDRRSELPAKYSIYDMAEDTVKVLDMLSVKDAAVYGVSQGGMIAQAIALSRPDIVSELILCSTAAYIPETAIRIFNEWIEYAEQKNSNGLVMSFAENIYTPAYCEKYNDVFIRFAEIITEDELQSFSIVVKGFEGFDVRDKLSKIRSSVLAVGADNDKLFGRETTEELARLTNGRIKIYKNESHSVYDENTEVIPLISTFLHGIME